MTFQVQVLGIEGLLTTKIEIVATTLSLAIEVTYRRREMSGYQAIYSMNTFY